MTREFRQSESAGSQKTGKMQVWRIWRKKNEVFVEHGFLGGKMQHTPGQKFEGVNIGKANEKDPEEVAQEWMDRQILLRTRKGWLEHDAKTGAPLQAVEKRSTTIDFSKPLPQNLRAWKPNQSIPKSLEKAVAEGRGIFTRKRDGNQHTIVKDDTGKWVMYSSTMAPSHKDDPGIPWLERYPKIHEGLKKLNVMNGTMLVGELVAAFEQDEAGFDIDDMNYVSTIVKSKKDEALEKQDDGGHLSFSIYDIIFLSHQPWYAEKEYQARLGMIHELVAAAKDPHVIHVEMFVGDRILHAGGSEALPAEVNTKSIDSMLAIAKDYGWEGFVLVERSAKFDEKGLNFAGKPQRPSTAAKVKPVLTADFMVRWDPDNGEGERGKGKKSTGVGAVFAYLWDPAKKEWRYITKVGGGLTDADVKRFADPKLYPMVWEVEFAAWTPDGSLQFPVFLRERDDKKPKECTVDQIPDGVGGETDE
jgi:hypothetical protein